MKGGHKLSFRCMLQKPDLRQLFCNGVGYGNLCCLANDPKIGPSSINDVDIVKDSNDAENR